MAVAYQFETWTHYFIAWADEEIDRVFRHEAFEASRRPTYVIRCDATGLVKIGMSHDPERRLRELQTGSPGGLRLVCLIEVDEFQAHTDLSEHRRHGEWFEWTAEVEAYVREHERGVA